MAKVMMPRYDLCDAGGVLVEDFYFDTEVIGKQAEGNKVLILKDGRMCFERGFKWDFGTGAVDTPAVILASLVHDGLCNLIEDTKLPAAYRKRADKEYKRVLKMGGMGWLRRQWQYHGIRLYVRLLKPIFG